MFPKSNLNRASLAMFITMIGLLCFAFFVQHKTLADLRPHLPKLPSIPQAFVTDRIGVTTVESVEATAAPTSGVGVTDTASAAQLTGPSAPQLAAPATASVEPASLQIAGRMVVLSVLAPKRHAKLLLRRTAGAHSIEASLPNDVGAWVAERRFEAPDIYREVGEFRALVVMMASDSAYDALGTDPALSQKVHGLYQSQVEHFLYTLCLVDWQKAHRGSNELPMACVDKPYSVMHPYKAKAVKRLLDDARSCADAIVKENADDVRAFAATIGASFPALPDDEQRRGFHADVAGQFERYGAGRELRMPTVKRIVGAPYLCAPAR